MGMGRGQDGSQRGPVAESIESRLLLSGGPGPSSAAAAAGAGIGGALRGDAYRLTVGNEVIEGTLHGDHLVIQAKANTIGGGTGREPFDEVIRIGSNTIGGTVGDPVTLVLGSNTVGGALHGEIGDDGILFRAGANTIGGTFHPDTYVIRFTAGANTIGGVTSLDVVIRAGANTIGGTLGGDVIEER